MVKTILIMVGLDEAFAEVKTHNLMKILCYVSSLVPMDCATGFSLILNTHLHHMAPLSVGKGTEDQVLFRKRARYSSLTAVFQFSYCKAC